LWEIIEADAFFGDADVE